MTKNMNEVVIIDTEYTTWPGAIESDWTAEDWMHREIIQIAAVRVNLETGEELEALDIIVKPKINDTLSDLCIDLTTITQERLDNEGGPFPAALEQLKEFCDKVPSTNIVTYGKDESVIAENCDINGVEYPFTVDWFKMRPALMAMGVDVDDYSSGRLHELTDTPLEGHVHYALHDVRSIAAFLIHQRKQDDEQSPALPPQHTGGPSF